MITNEVKKSIEESVLCWLATADQSGMPNCSPKEVFTFRGTDELIIANIASPESVKNIRVNPKVCVSFVHVFKQKGFKLKGNARYIVSSDESYAELYESVRYLAGDFPVQGIIKIVITGVAPILAPSYYLVSSTTEESQIESAKRAYGV